MDNEQFDILKAIMGILMRFIVGWANFEAVNFLFYYFLTLIVNLTDFLIDFFGLF